MSKFDTTTDIFPGIPETPYDGTTTAIDSCNITPFYYPYHQPQVVYDASHCQDCTKLWERIVTMTKEIEQLKAKLGKTK